MTTKKTNRVSGVTIKKPEKKYVKAGNPKILKGDKAKIRNLEVALKISRVNELNKNDEIGHLNATIYTLGKEVEGLRKILNQVPEPAPKQPWYVASTRKWFDSGDGNG